MFGQGATRATSTLILALSSLTWAASALAQPASAPPRPLPPGAVHPQPVLVTSLDPLPHEVRPNDWPQPDYFNEALKLTRFSPGASSKALKLTALVEPELLVLPVQTQVFGWVQDFNALVGARLDSELAARGLNANRQSDVFDFEGPFVRRFDAAAIAAFAAQHPKATVLALYLGRDGAGKGVVTLTLGAAGQQRRAHRAVDEAPDPRSALSAIAAALPSMLDELGLSARTNQSAAKAKGCAASEWQLADHPANATRSARACQALILGVLLPEFQWPGISTARPRTPAKLAWLAQAYSEADVFEPAAAEAMRAVAWSQMELGSTLDPLARLVDSDDPVIRPLARLLWAPERNQRTPVRSHYQASMDYVASVLGTLPAFARAAYLERLHVYEAFRRVDICALEVLLPAMRLPPECAEFADKSPQRIERATRAERALLQEWRLARGYKDIQIQGEERGDMAARQRVLDSLPTWIAAHPFVRYKRFTTAKLDSATGEYQDLLRRARAAVTEFVQATADQQRYGRMLNDNAVSHGRGITNTALRSDPQIVEMTKDEWRMLAVLDHDGFASMNIGLKKIAESGRYSFLRPGDLVTVRPAQQVFPVPTTPRPAATASATTAAPATAANVPKEQSPFDPYLPSKAGSTKALEQYVAVDRMAMLPRVSLALNRMKEGQTVAQARTVIDARADDKRVEYRIGESHAWVEPARMLLFAGEVEAGRTYYEKVIRIGTGSASDLHARARLHQIAGDIPGAATATQYRLDRYESDYARRDLAGFEFMAGQSERAWAVLTPRLSLSGEMQLWMGAMVGHRQQGLSPRQVRDWIAQSNYGHAKVDGVNIGALYLSRYITDDRVPTNDDVALVSDIGRQSADMGAHVLARVRLQQLAFAERVDAESLKAVQAQIHRSRWERRPGLKALYAWAVARSDSKDDASLPVLGDATLEGDFDSVLAKSVLLGLADKPAEAITFLRAARIELGYLSQGTALDDDVRSAPYTVALIGYLLYEKTRDVAYRDEALKVAKAYERIYPFLAWPYALTALVSADKSERSLAACRAQFLDAESQFLKLSGLKAGVGASTCQRPLFKGPASAARTEPSVRTQ